MDNKLDTNIKKIEFPMDVSVAPKPIVKQVTTQEQIQNLQPGGLLTLSMDGATYNQLYDQFKPQRRSGVLSFAFDSDKNLATIRNLKSNATEL